MSQATWLRSALPALLAGVALCVATDSLLAGEKIKISDTPEKVEIPKDPTKETLAPPSDFVHSSIANGQSSQVPFLPSPGQSGGIIRNSTLEQLLDRKKNWIFDSPNNVDRDKELKQIYGVKEYEFGGKDKKQSGVVDKYFESNHRDAKASFSGRPGENGPANDPFGRRKNFDPTGRSQENEDPRASGSLGIIPALNPAPLFNWRTGPEPMSGVNDGPNRSTILPPIMMDDTSLGQKTVAQPTREVNSAPSSPDKNWDMRRLPLNRLTDPINDPSDATRFAINPIAARKASLPPPEPASSRTAEPISFGRTVPVAAGPDLIGPSRSMPTGPSFTPIPNAPASVPVMQPRPGILEIPRPKF